MIQPPSPALLEHLTRLRLCRRRDVRRARRRVKALARELPAFDSVWIDALLQGKHLTPLQARYLETHKAEQLAVGPCVLLDRLGGGPNGESFLARNRDDGHRCVLKVLRESVEPTSPELSRLSELANSSPGVTSPHVIVPEHIAEDKGRTVLVSRFAHGIPGTELLIRRGRFPAAVVRQIGRQLIAGLSSLEANGLTHGDIALWNLRLTAAGEAVLVGAGVRPALSPEIFIRADFPPERYDGVAPERIATGQPATVRSDVYALGCLLWHLLAGRAVFPTGDPLTKLAHHQTRPVPDVREWSPDTPDDLAEIIARMTALEPTERPASFAELAAACGRPGSRGRKRLKRFHAAYRTSVPRIPAAGGSGMRRSIAVTISAALLLLMVGLLDIDFRTPLLRISASMRRTFIGEEQEAPVTIDASSATIDDDENGPGADRRIALPPPDRNGFITLKTSGPYLWNKPIRSRGTVTIQAGEDATPVVLMTRAGGRIEAPAVLLKGIHLRTVSGAVPNAVRVRCGQLLVSGCRFQRRDDASAAPASIHWSPIAEADVRNAVRIENTVFRHSQAALFCTAAPGRILGRNVLNLGGGFLRLATLPPAGRVCSVQLERVTLRDAESLLHVAIPESNRVGRIAVQARDCVFDLKSKTAALCVFRTAFPGAVPRHLVRFSGEGSLIPPGARIVADAGDASSTMETEAVVIDGGLIAGEFTFAGAADGEPVNSVIQSHRGPRRGNQPPGIDAGSLKHPQ